MGTEKEMWRHTGGGCKTFGNDEYPCDDDYENVETKEVVRIYSKPEAHFEMVEIGGFVESIEELTKKEGVSEKVEKLRGGK